MHERHQCDDDRPDTADETDTATKGNVMANLCTCKCVDSISLYSLVSRDTVQKAQAPSKIQKATEWRPIYTTVA
jgi:hypothetical protein